MPKVSVEHAQARKQQIIDAAYQCFARKGFHQTTMRDIYEEADLSPGAVYHYFENKDEIIQASFDFDYQRSSDLFSSAIASDDPVKSLEELLDFFLHGLKGAAALGAGRVNVQGWGEALVNPRLRETLHQVMGSYLHALTQVIHNGQEAGQIDTSLDPTAVGRLLLSVYYGLELQMALDPALDIDTYTAAATTLLRGFLTRA